MLAGKLFQDVEAADLAARIEWDQTSRFHPENFHL